MKTRLSRKDALSEKRDFLQAFSHMENTRFSILDSGQSSYNCRAWASGIEDEWLGFSYTLDDVIQELQNEGFELCHKTTPYEEEYEKIAIYQDSDGLVQHFARQVDRGQWTSKCGTYALIAHSLKGIEFYLYGKATIFMRRKKVVQ